MIQLAGIRFFMAGLLVLLFARILVRIPVWPRKIEWGVIAVVALIQTLGGYACSYIGMAHTQAAKASILSSLDVFFTMLLSHVVFRDDKLTIQKDLGLLLGMAGIVVINLSRGSISGSFSFTGEGLLVMASLLMSAAFIIIKKQSKTINLMRVNGWQHAIGGLLLGTLGYGGETQMIRFTGCSAGLLLYLVAVSAVTFSVWFLLLKHNKASEGDGIQICVAGVWRTVFGYFTAQRASDVADCGGATRDFLGDHRFESSGKNKDK